MSITMLMARGAVRIGVRSGCGRGRELRPASQCAQLTQSLPGSDEVRCTEAQHARTFQIPGPLP